MKELSIEDKAKRYDELKVTAQELEHDGCFDKITLFDLFPELKESEDERIRKRLIAMCQHYIESYALDPYNLDSYKEALAWLEKQGGQKPADIRTTGYWNVQEVEQKPAWSEEDEKIYQSIMDDTVQENQLDDKQTNWLRDIKYRYSPQPKQEWSEGNEIMIKVLDSIIRYIVEIVDKDALERFGTNREELFSWLKSLRPQSQWKPSDEQIEILDMVLSNESMDDNIARILRELREQLKKLTE